MPLGTRTSLRGGHPTELLKYFPASQKQIAQDQFVRLPNSADEAQKQVDDLKKAGVDGIKAVLEAGLKVPEQIAIIGAGNVHYSDLLRIPLSTIDQSSSVIGERAAELLSESMDAKKRPAPRRIFISPHLVVRDSSRRIR